MTPCQSPHSSVCVVPRCGEPNGLTGRFLDRLLCLLAGLVVIAGSPVLPALAQPLDPGSLIGVWSGRMTAMDDPSLNSKMVLTIKRVEAVTCSVCARYIRCMGLWSAGLFGGPWKETSS